MQASFWTSALIPIAVGLLFALLRRICPSRADNSSDASLTGEERRVYRRWEVGSVLPLFLFAPLLGYAWYLVLKGAAELVRHETPDTLILVQPTWIWSLPAGFLAIITSAIPVEWLYRALLRHRYRRFERFCNERAGFDAGRAMVWLAALVVAGSAVFFLAGVTSFARFTESGINIGRPLSLRSESYEYARVRAIEHRSTIQGPGDNKIGRPHYVIHFDDGTSWSTLDGLLRVPEPELDGRMAQLVSDRTGRGIVERP
jgi:hypothetical protein